MSVREASIRVNMKAQGFLSGLRQLLQSAETTATKMGTSFKNAVGPSFTAGIKKSKDALKDLGSGVKENMKNVATLGGAIGTGALINNAMQLQEIYGQVAFQLERSTGKAHSLAEVQNYVTSSARKTKRTHEELGNAMAVMLDRGADPTFAIQSLEAVGHVMNVTGKESEKVGRLLAGMQIKYGLNAQQASSMMDEVLVTQSAGKLSLEEYMEDFNEFGSVAKTAGLGGIKGLQFMLGMITKMGPALNGSTGEVSAGLDILFERLRDVGIVENIFKTAAPGVKFDKKQFVALDNAVDQLEALSKGGPKVMAAFKESFTGREETAAIEAMMGSYFKTYNEQIGKGVKDTQSHLDAMEDLRIDFDDMTKPIAEQGKIAEQSARIQETGSAKVRSAMNILSEAMTKPQMLEAIDSLAENMPTLASGFAKIIGFVVKHPLLAAGGFAAGKVGLSFASGALGEAGSKIGGAAAKSIATQAVAMGPWKTAGAALGIAAVAYLAYKGGEALIDSMYEARSKEHGAAVGAEASAFATAGGTNMVKKEQELQGIRAQLAKAKEEQSSVGGMASDAANSFFAALAGAGAAVGLNDDVGYSDTRADSIAKLEAAERELTTSIEKQKKSTQNVAEGGEQAAKALTYASIAANNFTKAMRDAGGDGLSHPKNTGPGFLFSNG
jgi:hypothetical protein